MTYFEIMQECNQARHEWLQASRGDNHYSLEVDRIRNRYYSWLIRLHECLSNQDKWANQ